MTQGCSSAPDLYDTRARKRLKLKKEKKNEKNYDRSHVDNTKKKKFKTCNLTHTANIAKLLKVQILP